MRFPKGKRIERQVELPSISNGGTVTWTLEFSERGLRAWRYKSTEKHFATWREILGVLATRGSVEKVAECVELAENAVRRHGRGVRP